MDSKKIAPSGLLKGFFNLANKYKTKEEEHDEKKLSVSTYRKSDEKENSSISEEGNHSFRSGPKNFYATNDFSFHDKYNDKEDKIKTIYLKNVKRSEILFLQKYRRILAEFEYRDPPKKLIKVINNMRWIYFY